MSIAEVKAMLEVKNVKKSFGGLQVLKGVSLSVNKGDVVAILGPRMATTSPLFTCRSTCFRTSRSPNDFRICVTSSIIGLPPYA